MLSVVEFENMRTLILLEKRTLNYFLKKKNFFVGVFDAFLFQPMIKGKYKFDGLLLFIAGKWPLNSQ